MKNQDEKDPIAKQNILQAVYRFCENLLACVLSVLFLMTIIGVILRYCFNTSIYGGDEIVSYLFVYLTALDVPMLLYTDSHLRVDFFANSSERKKKILFTVQYVLITLLNVFLLIQSMKWIGQVGSFLTPLLHVPQKWAQSAIPICMALSIVFGIGRLVAVLRRKSTEEK
jgi:TRAP-type C4-dicarboxylate transport system permease small subunit